MDGGMDSESVTRAGQPLPYTGRRRDWDRLREQFSAALISGDETGARRVFERLRLARVPLADQSEQVLAPVMHRIGEHCEAAAISGARVRVAAEIAERMLAWAVSCLDGPLVGAPLAMVVTPAGDDHRLPASMAGAVLRDGGWAVRHVEGIDAGQVVAVARRSCPALAVISFGRTDLGAAAGRLRDELAGTLRIPALVGGPGQRLRALREQADGLRWSVAGGLDRPTDSVN